VLFAEVDSGTIVVAIVVSVVAPSLLAWLNAQQARRSKLDEYKRQDDVAAALEVRQDASEARADAAARRAVEVAEQAARAAELLLAANERVAEQSAAAAAANAAELAAIYAQGTSIQDQTRKIHVLVNSNMTEAKNAQLAALVQFAGVTHEMFDLLRKVGTEPTSRALAALTETEKTIGNLRAELSEREATTQLMEAEAATLTKPVVE